jgi:hypothetical protein
VADREVYDRRIGILIGGAVQASKVGQAARAK